MSLDLNQPLGLCLKCQGPLVLCMHGCRSDRLAEALERLRDPSLFSCLDPWHYRRGGPSDSACPRCTAAWKHSGRAESPTQDDIRTTPLRTGWLAGIHEWVHAKGVVAKRGGDYYAHPRIQGPDRFGTGLRYDTLAEAMDDVENGR